MVLSSLSCPLEVQGALLGSPITLTLPTGGRELTVRYRCGSREGTVAERTGAECVTWTLPLELAAEYPALQRIPVELTLEITRGERVTERRQEALLLGLPESVCPTGTVKLTDIGGPMALCGSYVQNVSRLRVEVQGQGSQGAALVSCRIACGALTAEVESLVDFDLPQAGTVPVTVRLTDSRGRVTELKRTIEVMPWTAPQGQILEATPCDETGTAQEDGAYLLVEAMGSLTELPGFPGKYTLVASDGQEQLLGTGPELHTTLVIPRAEQLWLRIEDGLETRTFPYRPKPLLDLDVPGLALGIGCRGSRAGTVTLGLPVDMQGSPLTGLRDAQTAADALPLGQALARFLSPELLWENPAPGESYAGGEIAAAGRFFLVEAAIHPGGGRFWELVGSGGCLRCGEGAQMALRPVRCADGKMIFGAADLGDSWAIPLRVFRLLPGEEAI